VDLRVCGPYTVLTGAYIFNAFIVDFSALVSSVDKVAPSRYE